MEEIRLVPGDIYKHFKNKNYQIVTVAQHSETGEKLVIYQALYGDYKIYARPIEMFLSEVDHEKYPDISQKYRFEKVVLNKYDEKKADIDEKENSVNKVENIKHSSGNKIGNIDENSKVKSENYKDNTLYKREDKEIDKKDNVKENNLSDECGQVNPYLMEFLNAETYKEKLDVLSKMKRNENPVVLDSMAASLDFVLPEGDYDTKYMALEKCIRTFERYELRRR